MPIFESATTTALHTKLFNNYIANLSDLETAVNDFVANLPEVPEITWLPYSDTGGPCLLAIISWIGG